MSITEKLFQAEAQILNELATESKNPEDTKKRLDNLYTKVITKVAEEIEKGNPILVEALLKFIDANKQVNLIEPKSYEEFKGKLAEIEQLQKEAKATNSSIPLITGTKLEDFKQLSAQTNKSTGISL